MEDERRQATRGIAEGCSLQAKVGLAKRVPASLASRSLNVFRRALLGGSLHLRATSPERFAGRAPTLDELRRQPPPFRLASLHAPLETRRALESTCPRAAEGVLAAAQKVRSGSIDLLGAHWGQWPPVWNTDPSGTVEWPAQVSGRVVLARPPRSDADPKHPWELGRFQFAVPLAQAWWLTREDRWVEAYLELVDSWIARNPFPMGIHWASAMEVALRAFSWTWALWHLRDAPALDEVMWRRWDASLRDHYRYIKLCLEWEPLGNGNHYLANLLGLEALAAGAPGVAGESSGRHIKKRLEREVELQTLEDGANFEGSTAYHRFVTEMFVWAAALDDSLGPVYHRCVAKQLRYLDALCRADGSIPRIGDDDGGRVLPLSEAGTQAVLDTGFALIEGAPCRRHGKDPHPDLIWVGGAPALARWHASPQAGAWSGWRSFPHAGVHLLEGQGWHVALNSGPSRHRAGGGHLHSDLLGMVVHLADREIMIDPGTLSYAGPLKERDALRMSHVHTTITPEGAELRPLKGKFETGLAPTVHVRSHAGCLTAELGLAGDFVVKRNVLVTPCGDLEIADRVTMGQRRALEVTWVLGPDTVHQSVDERGRDLFEQESAAGRISLTCESDAAISIRVEPLQSALSYGISTPAQCVRLRIESVSETRIHTRLRCEPTAGQSQSSVEDSHVVAKV